MSRRRRVNLLARDEERVEVNISPLVDVVFLLLIFFVLSGTLMRERLLPVRVPESHGVSVPAPLQQKLLTVNASGEISLDGNPVDMARIRELAGNGRLEGYAIRIDRKAPAGLLVEVLSILPPSGIRVVDREL